VNDIWGGACSELSFERTTPKSRTIRLFISSTFRDMDNERELLIKMVLPELRKMCLERGVFLSEVDLRWGITTEQSKAGDTIRICLTEGAGARTHARLE